MTNNNFVGKVVKVSAMCDRFKCLGIVSRVDGCNAYIRVLTGEMANTLVKVYLEECTVIQFNKGTDSVKDVLEIIRTFKAKQVEDFEACLIHLYSCVHGDIEHYQSDDNKSIYFKVTCGRYSVCVGLELTDNGFKVVRKNKSMKLRYHSM